MYLKITLVGRLGRDPEMRYMPNGDPVTTFSVATDRQYQGRDGAKLKETTWVRVSVYGKAAEACNNFLSKGKMVLVEGRLSPDKETGGPKVYTKSDGQPGASYDVIAERVLFLSPRSEGAKTPKAEMDDDFPSF